MRKWGEGEGRGVEQMNVDRRQFQTGSNSVVVSVFHRKFDTKCVYYLIDFYYLPCLEYCLF